MRIFTKAIGTFLVTYLLFGCGKTPDNAAKKTIVCGKVINMQASPNIKNYTLELVDYSGRSANHIGHIDSNGSFKIIFDQFIAEDVKLDNIVGTFIAHPGDSIHIDIDLNNMSSVKFSGDGSKTNTDINKYTNQYYSDYDKYQLPYTDVNNYKAYCENLKSEMYKKLDEFSASANPNQETTEWIKNYINIQYYSALLNFPYRYCYYKDIQLSDWVAPKGYYNMADLNNVTKSSVLNSGYYELPNRYLGEYILRKQKTFTLDKLINGVNQQLIGNDLFKQVVLGSILDSRLNINDLDFYNKNRNLIEPNLQAFIKQPLQTHYANVQNDFKNVHLNTNATLRNIAGTAAEGIIDSIRKANKGKVVYVDFWATWCAPCKKEMPASNKLQQKLRKENIAFIYICLDSEPNTWKFTLSKLNLSGIQYYSDKRQSLALQKAFHINGIPFHMLLNKNGDIVESGNCLGANDPLTEKKIMKLLSKNSIDKQVSSNL
ncbi:TlpA family protein disulfide reductase [Mucilaginibacter arboris]|uniref:Redoxin family protein n=1 Tax=Mucilaginibacter arboris TaxID=2682090 RepID=A0A7K1SW53_9SPHI|nr:thioredoxin-like domain-containing protein [Mucilaginibacter arboris]MVN21569.1 redoxin family protein [Mucilaginibacter arboris]